MGAIMKNGKLYGGSGDTASDIVFDSTSSGLPASTVQSAIDYLKKHAYNTDGIVVNVEIENWIEQTDGTFTNTIAVSEVVPDNIYDVSLYGDFTEEQAEAFDFLVSSIDTADRQIVLTALEKVDVAFSIILRGKVNLEDKNVYVSDLSATSIDYDNSKSNLDATNMQNAMDEVATMVNGIVVNVTSANWDLQDDGTYKKIIALEQITGTETFDVCLDPSTTHTEEQIRAFAELVSSIDTAEGRIILIATEAITVSFKIFLYGKINFGKGNLVALSGDFMEVTEISKENYEKLSAAEKANGCFYVPDGDGLVAKNIEYDGSVTGLGSNVQNAIDNLSGTFSINNAGSHNCIYRGKNLGSSVTTAQYNAISAGTFEDLYIGDYWVINGVNWRIAAFDYYYRCGDTDLTTHHAVIVPDSNLYEHVMNDTKVTTGGYVGSKMYTEGLVQAKTTIKQAFPGHVLNHRVYLVNEVTEGYPSGAGWYDSEVDLMNEHMVYGGPIFLPMTNGAASLVHTNYRVEKSQLPLFSHRPDLISNRMSSWLRDVVSSSGFAIVNWKGEASVLSASYSQGVRPAFCIY